VDGKNPSPTRAALISRTSAAVPTWSAEGGLVTCRVGAQTCSGVGKVAGAETVGERLMPQTG
jgi:hypothetical protein